MIKKRKIIFRKIIVSDDRVIFKKFFKWFQQFLDVFLRAYIARVFSDAWLPQSITPLPVQTPYAHADQIAHIARMVRDARAPLLLMGSQAVCASPTKADELAKCVEV